MLSGRACRCAIVIKAPARAVVERPDPAHAFELTITFDAVPDGTLVTWRQRFDDREHFEQIKDFVADANLQVLARLVAVATGR